MAKRLFVVSLLLLAAVYAVAGEGPNSVRANGDMLTPPGEIPNPPGADGESPNNADGETPNNLQANGEITNPPAPGEMPTVGSIIRVSGELPNNFTSLVTAAGGEVKWVHPRGGMAAVRGLGEARANALASEVGGEATPDITFELQTPDVIVSEESYTTSASDPTTATFYARQWHHRAIGADVAWAAGHLGSPGVTVAVIDTGISYTHPDLQGRVDLSRSISLRPDDDAFVAANFPGHHPITDVHFHGTHVASTISSNGIVGAGVTSRVTLIGVKVINRFGRGTFADVLQALYYAVDQGADVANLSIGSFLDKPHNGQFVAAVQQAFNYAHRKGTLVVVAAGNEMVNLDKDGPSFKLYCSAANVVCVSATGPTSNSGINGPWVGVDTFAWYSNYGRSAIDVAAPGGTSAGVVWAACTKTSFGQPLCLTQDRLVGSTGTSMAAPHVSGLAALLVDEIGHGRPSQVKARLLQSADDLGARGTDPFYGKGRINAPRALGLQ